MHRPGRQTEGIETSQYLEEKKAISDSVSSGERTRNSLNRKHVIDCIRCVYGVVGCPVRVVQDPGGVTNLPASRTALDKRDHRR